MPPRFLSLWSINAPLDAAELGAQLRRFKAAGLDGVVFHPRFYPGEPAYLGARYLEILSETILCARDLGLAFWIYDENGWPSGTVGGAMLARHSEVRQQWAGLYRERPAEVLHSFTRDGGEWFVGLRHGAGVDYLNPALAPRFIELTHEAYARGLAPEAWAYVEAVFCDEPEFGLGHAHQTLPSDGAIPWTPDLPELFAATYGEPLLPQLRGLFFAGPDAAETRVRFWELLRDRFCTGFLKPINDWCGARGKRFTAHIKGEEHPLFQVPMIGSCSAVFRHLSLPGIDALARFPSNDFFPRQLVSSAQQFGDGRCMVEAFGGAGWGARPEDLERYLLWLGRNGVTDFVLHLSQYRLSSAAIRDWPPSQPLHLTWVDAYPEVLRRVAAALAAHPPAPADTLVISPHRAIMAAYEPRELAGTNIHDAATHPDSPAVVINRTFLAGIATLQTSGAAWHVTDEATFEALAQRSPEGVTLGHGRYRRVFAAEGVVLPSPWNALPRLSAAPAPPPVEAVNKESFEPVSMGWELAVAPINSLLIEVSTEPDHWFRGTIPALSAEAGAELAFADDVVELIVAENTLPLQSGSAGSRVAIPPGGERTVRLRYASLVRAPFLWLHGKFLVRRAGVTPGTPFCLAPLALNRLGTDLIAAGFPFLRAPLVVRTTFRLEFGADRLRLDGIAADAVRVRIDGIDAGWVWGPDWLVRVPVHAGGHTLELWVVPNGFNHYGPHHHYLGDRPLVSPDQFAGGKNFADPADAPACTLTPDWHFVPLLLPATLSFSRFAPAVNPS